MQGKTVYDSIVIPEELDRRVNEAIASVDKTKVLRRIKKQKRQRRMLVAVKSFSTMAAAFLVCILVGVNTNQVFAENLGNLPVVGGLFRVFTIRSYEQTEGDVNYNVQVPQIAVGSEGAGSYTAEQINAQIAKISDAYLEKCKTDMEEYKEAFFATGGTEEEWAGRMMDVNVTYDVKCQQGNLLSLVLTTSVGWFTGEMQNMYYNLDLATGKKLTLADVLGEDYIQIANEIIIKQIGERLEKDDGLTYWGYGADKDMQDMGFRTVDENTSFYINTEGRVVVCFGEYEIAPGFMGIQEFVIE